MHRGVSACSSGSRCLSKIHQADRECSLCVRLVCIEVSLQTKWIEVSLHTSCILHRGVSARKVDRGVSPHILVAHRGVSARKVDRGVSPPGRSRVSSLPQALHASRCLCMYDPKSERRPSCLHPRTLVRRVFWGARTPAAVPFFPPI